MQRKFLLAIVVIVILVAIGLIWLALQPPDSPNFEANIINAQDFEIPSIGFAPVDGTYDWEFPHDLGPHSQFQREEWQLATTDSCALQLDMHFDRVSILPQILRPDRPSEWAITAILNATLTLSDSDQTLIETNRTSRVALDLAGADDNHVWLENWFLDWQNGEFTLTDPAVEVRLTLTLDAPQLPSNSDDWYTYQQSGHATGQITLNDPQMLDCPITLTHRFGS